MTTQTIRTGYNTTGLETALLRAAVALETAAMTRILSRADNTTREAEARAAADRRHDARALGSLGIIPR